MPFETQTCSPSILCAVSQLQLKLLCSMVNGLSVCVPDGLSVDVDIVDKSKGVEKCQY